MLVITRPKHVFSEQFAVGEHHQGGPGRVHHGPCAQAHAAALDEGADHVLTLRGPLRVNSIGNLDAKLGALHGDFTRIDMSGVTDIDTTAADALKELVDHLATRGIELRFAELKGTVRERLERYEVFDQDAHRFAARTVGEAVKQYLGEQQVPWVDWEDRPDDGDSPADRW